MATVTHYVSIFTAQYMQSIHSIWLSLQMFLSYVFRWDIFGARNLVLAVMFKMSIVYSVASLPFDTIKCLSVREFQLYQLNFSWLFPIVSPWNFWFQFVFRWSQCDSFGLCASKMPFDVMNGFFLFFFLERF